MTWALGQSGTLHRRASTTVDADGNDVEVFTDVSIKSAAVYPLDGDELLGRGDLVNDFRRLVTIPPVQINPQDEVTIAGYRWKVDGPSAMYDSPLTGTRMGSVVLKRTTG